MTANPTNSLNGHVPADDLVIVGGAPLWWGSAHAFNVMAQAASMAGVGVAPINEWSGNRNIALQEAMVAHPGSYGVAKVNGRYVTQKPPGHSTHGWGTALDIYSGHEWVKAHGAKYGWHWTLGNADPYHFEHDGKTAIGTRPGSSTASTGTVTAVPEPKPKGPNMKNWSIVVERDAKKKNLGIHLIGDGADTLINTLAMTELKPVLAGGDGGNISTGTYAFVQAHLAAIGK